MADQTPHYVETGGGDQKQQQQQQSPSAAAAAAMLQQSHPLRRHLQQTHALTAQLKKDAEILQGAYNKLKQEYAEMEARYVDQKDRADLAVQAKIAAEKESELLVADWTDKFNAQQRKMKAATARMVPSRAVEMLRVELAEELNYEHQQRVKSLSEEISRYRDAYLKEHHQLELLRQQVSRQDENSKRAQQELRAHMQSELDALAEKNHALQELVEDPAQRNALREKESESAELQLRLSKLMDELSELRGQRDAVTVAREQDALAHQKQLKTEQGRALVLEQEALAQNRRVGALRQELVDESKEKRALHDRVLTLEQLVAQLRHQVASGVRELQHTSEHGDGQLVAAQHRFDLERERLQKQLTAAEQSLTKALRKREEALDKLASQGRAHSSRLREQEDEAAARFARSDTARNKAEARVSSLVRQLEEQENTHRVATDGLRQQIHLARASNQSLVEERNTLSASLVRERQAKDELSGTLAARMKEFQAIETQLEVLQAKHRELMGVDSKARELHASMAQEKESLSVELESVRQELSDARAQQLQSMAKSKASHTQEMGLLRRRLGMRVQELVEAAQGSGAELAALRKAKNRYKRLVVHLQQRLQEQTRELTQLKAQVSALQAASVVAEHRSKNSSSNTHSVNVRLSAGGGGSHSHSFTGSSLLDTHRTVLCPLGSAGANAKRIDELRRKIGLRGHEAVFSSSFQSSSSPSEQSAEEAKQ